jgi:hypothetical protein
MRDIIVAALAYVVPTFPLAYVWHLTVFKDRYAALKIYRNDVVPLFGLTSMVIQAIAFAFIYVDVISPIPGGWPTRAATYAVLGGFLSWSFTTIAPAAKSPMTSIRDFFAIETAFTALQWIIVGLATALLVS